MKVQFFFYFFFWYFDETPLTLSTFSQYTITLSL